MNVASDAVTENTQRADAVRLLRQQLGDGALDLESAVHELAAEGYAKAVRAVLALLRSGARPTQCDKADLIAFVKQALLPRERTPATKRPR